MSGTEWRLRRILRWIALAALPAFSAAWAGYSTSRDPAVRTDLDAYPLIGRAILAGKPFYTGDIPGQFFLSPVGALGTLPLLPMSDPARHIVWSLLCTAAVLIIGRLAGLRGFFLSLLVTAVLMLPPARFAMTYGRITLLVAALVICDLIPWRRPRWLPRGVATGLAGAVWPFLWPFGLVLLLRDRRAGLIAGSVFAALSAAAALALPRMTLTYWTAVLPARFTLRDSNLTPSHQSVLAALGRIVGPVVQWPAVLLMLSAGIACGIAALWWGRLGRPWLMVAMASLAMLVALPVVTVPDLAWILVPVLAATLWRHQTPDGIAIVTMFTLAWILADPLGAIRRGVPTENLNLVERLLLAGTPLLALALLAIGLVSAWVVARTPPGEDTPTARFWHRRPVVVTGILILTFGAAVWQAALADADVYAFLHWRPQMPDFAVYVRAGDAFLAGQSLYATDAGQWPFLYPPVAALFAIPLAVVPLGVAQLGWLLLTAAALLLLLHRLGLRGWGLAFVGMICIVLAGPIRSTFSLGQVSVLLMVMCLLDVAPGRGLLSPRPRERLIPQGVLIGLATTIKLTPGLFIPLLWLTGRRRAAMVAAATTAATILLGFLVSPRQSVFYWSQVATGKLEFFPDPRGWMHNQSFVSAWQRFVGLEPGLTALGMATGAALTILGLVAAVRWVRRGHELIGAALCGLATLQVLPVGWNHYYVWALPLAIALFRPGVPRPLRIIGQITALWLLAEPFWGVAYAGPDPGQFVAWGLLEKLVGGGGALLAIATIAVALLCRAEPATTDDLLAADGTPAGDRPRASLRPPADRPAATTTRPPRADRPR